MASNPTVIVGTDLSAGADEAARQGCAWAKRIGGKLVVVHVAPEEALGDLTAAGAIEALEERMRGLLGDPGETLEVQLAGGSVREGLIRSAEVKNAQLLCVGASGAHGVQGALYGTTAEQIVRYAGCRVLVARPSPDAGGVLAATDFSPPAALAVSAAVEEAERRGSTLTLLHSIYTAPSPLSALGPMVFSPPEATPAGLEALRTTSTEMLRSTLDAAKVDGKLVVAETPPANAIVEHAARASLVVVGTHGRTGLSRVALGSIAEAVARNAPCSVLAVRNVTP